MQRKSSTVSTQGRCTEHMVKSALLIAISGCVQDAEEKRTGHFRSVGQGCFPREEKLDSRTGERDLRSRVTQHTQKYRNQKEPHRQVVNIKPIWFLTSGDGGISLSFLLLFFCI